ncbi:MAG TPA: nodulation protein NfeD [Anaeromyxobacteraceae bacterium]|nr:nodulation protein NfeD [Anaeromyxobacteraceae bacterium]
MEHGRRGRALRLAVSIAALLAGALGLAAPKAERAPKPAAAAPAERGGRLEAPLRQPRVLSLEIQAAITTGTAEYVAAGVEKAGHEGFDALVITLDTPGGHLEATRDVVQRMLAAETPIIVWVGPAGARAGSAGVFITMAANVAAMHPASNIGAAHPVLAGGGDVEKEAGRDMAKKVENDTAAFARSIAKSRGRSADWAEKAVRQSVSATAGEALKLKVVDLTAPDLASVLREADGRTVEVKSGKKTLRTRDAAIEPLPMTLRQKTLAFLSDPNVVAILMLIGTLGIALEFYHPGSIVPGAVGAFCLLLAFLSMRVIPVNVGAVVLLIAGVGLLIAEAYVTTHGIAGAAGAVCIGIGTLLFIDKSSAEYQFDPAAFTLSPLIVWPTPIALTAILGFVAWKVVRSRQGRLVSGQEGLLGETGEALTEVGPEGGEVFVHGEYWRARSAARVPKGARVRVAAVDGLTVTVEAEPGPAIQD